jgi:tRNA threonylcarbamoyl adenosine modification protein YjeE
MTSVPDAMNATCAVGDESGLVPIALALVDGLPAHACITLSGDLGSGKTTLVKAVATAAGIDPAEVVSPTFGLIHEHFAAAAVPPIRLVHADLYRLAGPEDLLEVGWEDATAARPGMRAWTLVEWPERIAAALPADRLDIAIDITSDTGRTFAFMARGAEHAPAIAALRRRLDQ